MASRPNIRLSITEKDLGLGHILKEAAKLRKKPAVKVGVTQAKGSKLHTDPKTGKQVQTVADIMAHHEYGAPKANIPERSVIRSTVIANQTKYDSHIAQLGSQIFDVSTGMTTERALGLIGQEIVADMKNTIRTNHAGLNGPTPLKAATIREKNQEKIGKASAKVRALEAKPKLTKGDKERLFQAQELIDTGGVSIPLIDTSQMINSINYQVMMEGLGPDYRDAFSSEGAK